MARSITFVVDGDVDTQITITEQADGTLLFELEVLGTGSLADLRALFFDVAPGFEGLLGGLTINAGTDVTDFNSSDDSVTTLGGDANINGQVVNELGAFDVGVEFGAAGPVADDIQSTSFVLGHESQNLNLSLDMLNLADFGVTTTSIGTKTGDQANGVADNDTLDVDENASNSINVLINDTNGAGNTVTAVEGGFVQPVTVDGLELGQLTVNADGTATFDANGADVDSLAAGEQKTYTVTYTSTAPDGSLATADVTITVTGTNDAPVVSVDAGDSDSAMLTETDTTLATAGSLTVTDVDVSDTVNASVTGVTLAGVTGGLLPADVLGFLTLGANPVLDSTETTVQLGWSFNSGAQAFDFLAAGETLTLTYTVEADDGVASDTHDVAITITGTDDKPTFYALAGDSAFGTFTETDSGLTRNGTVTLIDPDISDEVVAIEGNVTVERGDAGPLSNADLSSFFSIAPEAPTLAIDGTSTEAKIAWSFNTGSEAFDFLAKDEELELLYDIDSDDQNGGPNGRGTVTFIITGTNDGPTLAAGTMAAQEDGLAVGLDLATLGDDVDSDDDGTTLAYAIVSGPGEGSAWIAGTTLNFDPGAAFQDLAVDETRDVVVRVRATDSHGAQAEADVTVTVTGVNDDPVADDDAYGTTEDTVLNVAASGVLTNDTDVDTSDTLAVGEINGQAADVGTAVTLGSGAIVTLNADGSFDYNPNGQFEHLAVDESATDSFVYTVDDGNGGTDTATVEITIDGVNDDPVANDDAYTTDEDTVLNVAAINGVLANDDDIDTTDMLTVTGINGSAVAVGTAVTLASGALVTLNADGSFDYDPNGQFEGLNTGDSALDTFSYTVSDGNGGTATAQVDVTVEGVTDQRTEILATFEELSVSGSTGPIGSYLGLNWSSNFFVVETDQFFFNGGTSTGYHNGVVSGQNVGFNAFQAIVSIFDSNFDLESAYLTAAWNDGLTVRVTGFKNGSSTGQQDVVVSTAGPTFVQFNDSIFDNVDSVRFDSFGGTNAGLGGLGEHFAIDDITFFV